MGTMPVFLTETFPSFHFERDHFVALYVIDDLSFDNSLYIFSNGQGVAMRKEDVSEFYFIAGVTCDPGDIQGLIFLDLKLLTGYFHYC